MKRPFRQTILCLLACLWMFSGTSTVIENTTFSEEYHKLLASVDKNGAKSRKCYENDTKILIEDIMTQSERNSPQNSDHADPIKR